MKKVFRILGAVLLVIVAVALAAYAWAMSVATRKYETHWTTHDASFPIPWPLSDAQIDTLKRAHGAAGRLGIHSPASTCRRWRSSAPWAAAGT